MVSIIIAGGIGFFAGKHVEATAGAAPGTRFGQMGMYAGGMRGMRGGMNGGFVSGQILSKDATSITVALRGTTEASLGTQTGAGSKIVFLGDNTKIMKTVDGTLADLADGKDVVVTGTPNQDGSITATSIQIRTQNTSAPVVNQ